MRQVAQMENSLEYQCKQIIDLHLMSSPKSQDTKASVAMCPKIGIIPLWIRVKRPMRRFVGLRLCCRMNVNMWKRRRMVLAEIPMPILERNAFLRLIKSCSWLVFFISWLRNHGMYILGVNKEKVFISNSIICINLSLYYYHQEHVWIHLNTPLSHLSTHISVTSSR